MFRSLLCAIAILALACAASCGGKTDGKSDKAGKDNKTDKASQSDKSGESKQGDPARNAGPASNEGGETPEKAFEGFVAAMGAKGAFYSKVLTFIPPDERAALAILVHNDAESYAALDDDEKAADEYAAIVSKHKVIAKPEGLEEHQIAEAMDSFPKMLALGKRMMKGVDIAAYVKDAEAFLNKHSEDDESTDKLSDLKDVKIDGDKASAKAKTGEDEKTILFKKAGGRWFVSIETMLN